MLMATQASASDQLFSKSMISAIALTLVYLGLMFFLYRFPISGVFEPKFLLPILNTIFTGALPLAVAFIAVRLYVSEGRTSFLLMGGGLIAFGSSAILAGWLRGGDQGPNVNVTIYNVGALLGALLHAAGIVLAWRHEASESGAQRRMVMILGGGGS